MTHILFEFGIFLLCVDEVKNYVEGSGKNEREEEAETSEVGVPLRTMSACPNTARGRNNTRFGRGVEKKKNKPRQTLREKK